MPESQTITLKESHYKNQLSTIQMMDYQPFRTEDSKHFVQISGGIINKGIKNDQVHTSINDYLKEEEISKI